MALDFLAGCAGGKEAGGPRRGARRARGRRAPGSGQLEQGNRDGSSAHLLTNGWVSSTVKGG